MGAVLGKCLGGLDDKKIDMAVDKGFGFFDKDKSGFVDGAEAAEAAQKVLNMIGGPAKKVTPEQIQTAFGKAAGADQKMDKAEFGNLIKDVVEKAGGPKTAHAATAVDTPAAAPAAAAAVADAAPAVPAAPQPAATQA
jgi:hypothetical protein